MVVHFAIFLNWVIFLLIIVKYSDTDHAVSDGVYKTERYTVDRLKSDYYVNSGQKAEVNGYVNKLKSLDDLGD